LAISLNASGVRALLLDIEGTTTPIDFVFKTLFPFAAAHARDFLLKHFDEPEVAEVLDQLREANRSDVANGAPAWTAQSYEQEAEAAEEYVRWLIAKDSKLSALKTLQGKIWEEGFRGGELKGEVYSDVAPAFARWEDEGRRVAIFSSGSVLAQKMLFAHSAAGDLGPFIAAYFDTTTGPKRDDASYRKISAALGMDPGKILFVSDVSAELDAAQIAGMQTALSLRPGVTPQDEPRHEVIHDFVEICS
jgi:enolase-phosphatase E1